MNWWLSAAAKQLRDQINARWPGRDKRSDGSVGDLAHAIRKSDHNPDPTSNPPLVVRAIDIDEDFTGPDDPLANKLLIQLLALNDPRVKYCIFESCIYSRKPGGDGNYSVRPYNGPNKHAHHIHVSFTERGDHDATPFALPILEASAHGN